MRKILVVEDEIAYLKLLQNQLTKSNYEVIKAENGKVGLAVAKRIHPDLIILDLRMPVMDGIAMLNELRKDPYGETVKVIVLTNLEPNDLILKELLVDKPTYYLIKSDIQLTELLEKVKELLEA